MNEKLRKEYARVIVKIGANVQKGQDVILRVSTDNAEIAADIVEECYKCHARRVTVEWLNDGIRKMNLKSQSIETLSEFDGVTKAKYQYMAEKLPVMIYVEDSDPDVLADVPVKKMIEPRKAMYPKIKKYRDAMEGKYQWVIVAMPSLPWAKKMYPDLKPEEAMKKLEKAIIKTMRMDKGDPYKNWKDHIRTLEKKAAVMNRYHFKSLHYTSSNGTDFTVGLHPKHIWCTAYEKELNGVYSCVNMPTEEVFTFPDKYTAEGVVVASKPLSYNGTLIEDFEVYFKNGKAVKVFAKKGQKQFEEMIGMDAGSCYLGEVALVPYDSPINKIGTLFYNTLFDENASCHIALGAGIKEAIEGAKEMSVKEAVKKENYNESMIHTDFMIGSKDMKIVGTDAAGKEVTVFEKGRWAI